MALAKASDFTKEFPSSRNTILSWIPFRRYSQSAFVRTRQGLWQWTVMPLLLLLSSKSRSISISVVFPVALSPERIVMFLSNSHVKDTLTLETLTSYVPLIGASH